MIINELKIIIESLKNYFKTNRPNWLQNDSSQIDYIKNRTHYDSRKTVTTAETISLTFDGIIDGKEIITYNEYGEGFIKLLDTPFTREQLLGGTASIESYTFTIDESMFIPGTDILGMPGFFNIPEDNTDVFGFIFSKGVWTDIYPDENGNLTIDFVSFTNTITTTTDEGELKKLDEKYIPNIADWAVNDKSQMGYIKNRTHYDSRRTVTNTTETISITYDGNISTKENISINPGFVYVKVSDTPITVEQLLGCTVTYNGGESETISDGMFGVIDEAGSIMTNIGIIAAKDNTIFDGIIFNKGIWFFHNIPNNEYATSLSKIITTTTVEGELKKLDVKYIPDSIARTADIIQSNWNQNDETQLDYIKNRTHYDSVDYIPIIRVPIVIKDQWIDGSSDIFNLKNGDVVKVYLSVSSGTIPSQEYVCKVVKKQIDAAYAPWVFYIGNGNKYYFENNYRSYLEDTGEPFCITISESFNQIRLSLTDAANNGSCTIFKSVEVTHQLPQKYI